MLFGKYRQGNKNLLTDNLFGRTDQTDSTFDEWYASVERSTLDTRSQLDEYKRLLVSTLRYSIDKLNNKAIYSNMISFCAKILGNHSPPATLVPLKLSPLQISIWVCQNPWLGRLVNPILTCQKCRHAAFGHWNGWSEIVSRIKCDSLVVLTFLNTLYKAIVNTAPSSFRYFPLICNQWWHRTWLVTNSISARQSNVKSRQCRFLGTGFEGKPKTVCRYKEEEITQQVCFAPFM